MFLIKNIMKYNKKFIIIFFLMISYSFILTFFGDKHFIGLPGYKYQDNKVRNKNNQPISTIFEVDDIFEYLKLYFDRFYFVLVTTSTVGYGTITIISRKLKIINSIYILILLYTFII